MSDPVLPGDPQEVWIVVKPSGAIVHECQPYRTEARALERRRASAGERVIGPFVLRTPPEADKLCDVHECGRCGSAWAPIRPATPHDQPPKGERT